MIFFKHIHIKFFDSSSKQSSILLSRFIQMFISMKELINYFDSIFFNHMQVRTSIKEIINHINNCESNRNTQIKINALNFLV